jgi:proteasome alpha subunit
VPWRSGRCPPCGDALTIPFYVPPEQLIKDKAEYARKGIARGRSIVAIEYADGVLLMAENPSRTLHKISEIYDRLAFAGAGRYNEFENLRQGGIRFADVTGYMYSRQDVTGIALANAFAETLGRIFTHEMKPWEVEVLVAEVGVNGDDNRLFKVTYDGTLYDERGVSAVGGKAEQLTEMLQAGHEEGASLDEALRKVADAFRTAEERDMDGWEAAVLDRGRSRRLFRRLSLEDLAAAQPK